MEFTQIIHDNVRTALAEDIGSGDLTAALIPTEAEAQASIICREAAVICGRPWVDEVFRQLDRRVQLEWRVAEGRRVEPGQELLRLQGSARALLTGERTALNFLQSLSGTATEARRYADTVAGLEVKILDTRKTLPGLRAAQKYAVRCGGCHNHRHGLYDGVLIKENHILAAGSITAAVSGVRPFAQGKPVEVEVETLAELREALAAGADIIMLDNFSSTQTSAAVAIAAGRAKLEVSGNVSLEGLRALAETGVDYISTGALTKHLRAVDLSMRFR
ncbi:nicotinate-nucleotide pyrophosphorylase [Candidatus Tenderia electrophaga]|jgi:nicotinate-nucleotide pyrophosphorylase (carboxylating)|uniref:Probable nicotinate-nucleotide pyrophosphorylase [carboxylating] n=1 Tax=Candidatus Tenderia electrophaga TaxID=1748243 RepID=A0A0S2TBJ5_9GAMM|nr:nicotinate-nucleotide pyrophosphorylase [Candidatus Tenderia electrophaga]